MSQLPIDCSDPKNANKCNTQQPNFPDFARIRNESQKLVREMINPHVSPAEEDEHKRAVIGAVFGTIYTIIGFATAIVVSNFFAAWLPIGDLATTITVIIVAIGITIVIGILQVRFSRAVLKTRYFPQTEMFPEVGTPTKIDPDAIKIRTLYEKAHRICTQAELWKSYDQTLVEGSFALNLRNTCTEEVFNALVRKSNIGEPLTPTRRAPPRALPKKPKERSDIRRELVSELEQVFEQKFGGPIE